MFVMIPVNSLAHGTAVLHCTTFTFEKSISLHSIAHSASKPLISLDLVLDTQNAMFELQECTVYYASIFVKHL